MTLEERITVPSSGAWTAPPPVRCSAPASGTRTAIALSSSPGVLAALAIVDAIRHAREPNSAAAHRSGSGCDR